MPNTINVRANYPKVRLEKVQITEIYSQSNFGKKNCKIQKIKLLIDLYKKMTL